jgi:hypothetical protein
MVAGENAGDSVDGLIARKACLFPNIHDCRSNRTLARKANKTQTGFVRLVVSVMLCLLNGGDMRRFILMVVVGTILGVTLASAQEMKTVKDRGNHCQATIPADWVASAMGFHAASNIHFSLDLRGLLADEFQSDVTMYKSMHATVVDDSSTRVLLSVPTGARKQLIAITKSSPMGCRASVTIPDSSKNALGRKIAESATLAK